MNHSVAESSKFAQYRLAEQAVWDYYQLKPEEALVPIGRDQVVRLHQVGTGDPILFVHGTGGPGAYWAPLVAELSSSFKCIMIDRPGWTQSTPLDYSNDDFATIASKFLNDLSDSLQIQTAHVIGGSIGNLYALRFALAHPDRVRTVVLAGAGPITAAIKPPTFIKLLRTPIGQIMVRIPQKPAMVRKQMEGLGHNTSLDHDLIPDELIEVYSATTRHTRAMHHERDLVKAIANSKGFVPSLALSEDDKSRITTPVLMVYGDQDPVGSETIWQEFTGKMANGGLQTINQSGHLPWYDKPQQVARHVSHHLATPQQSTRT